MKVKRIFIIFGFALLFATSNILAQPIAYLPDDLDLEQEVVKKRGEVGRQLLDKAQEEFFQKKDYEKSREYCLKILAINPDDYEANIIIGGIYAKNYDFKKAVEYFQKATNVYPRKIIDIEIVAAMGFFPDDKNYYQNLFKAIEDYENEIVNNPSNYQAYNDLGYLSSLLGMHTNVGMEPKLEKQLVEHYYKREEYYKKSIAIKPDYAQAHYNLARCYLSEDKKLALEEYKILETLNKDLAKVILRTIELVEKRQKE